MSVLLLVMALLAQEKAESDDVCIRCHQDQAVETANSVHAKGNIGCTACHGTDEIENGKHMKVQWFRPSRLKSIASDCGICHLSVTQAFEPSLHANFAARDDGEKNHRTSCSACHGYHDVVPARRFEILKRCRQCHEEPSEEYTQGREAFRGLAQLEQDLARLGGRLTALDGRPGIMTRDTSALFQAGTGSMADLKVAQHGADFGRVISAATASSESATGAYNTLAIREREFGRRTLYLVPVLGLIALMGAVLWFRGRTTA